MALFSQLKRNYRWYLGILGVLLAAVVIYMNSGSEDPLKDPASEPISVRFYVVSSGSGDSRTEYTGTVRSHYEARLAFQTAGKIISREVERGQAVHAGQVLALLDTRDLQQSVRNAEAQAGSAQAQLDLAQRNIQRYENLLAAGAVSQEAYDQYKQQYEAAAALVEQGQAQVEQSRNQLGYSQLIADRDGVIVKLDAEPGQYVSAGESVMTLANAQALEIEFAVPERDMGNIHLQDAVQVRCWALPGRLLPAVIREISQMADADTQTFKVRAAVTEATDVLKLGMSAAVQMSPDETVDLCVPLAAVFEHEGQKGVWLEQDGRVHFAPVVLGLPVGKDVEVKDGLHPGDRIVAAGVDKLQEGALVKGEDF